MFYLDWEPYRLDNGFGRYYSWYKSFGVSSRLPEMSLDGVLGLNSNFFYVLLVNEYFYSDFFTVK